MYPKWILIKNWITQSQFGNKFTYLITISRQNIEENSHSRYSNNHNLWTKFVTFSICLDTLCFLKEKIENFI